METSATTQGQELIDGLRLIDTRLAAWLIQLDAFDTWGTWAEDGHSSCVSWLVDRCGLARRTAKDKLRVAKQLGKRKLLADALAQGRVSYSQIRCITRIDDANDELDQSLLESAAVATVADLERVVRYWKQNREQETLPEDRYEQRGARRIRGHGGALDRLVISLPAEDIDRIFNVVNEYLDHLDKPAQPVDKDSLNPPMAGGPVDEGSLNPPADIGADPAYDEMSWRKRRAQRLADGIVDLFEHVAYQHHDTIDIQRASIGVTVDYDTLVERAVGRCDLASGATLTGEAARRLACDAGIHRIIVKGRSEILDVGRKTRDWTTAQRRAIAARHGHRCAIKGCGRKISEIHHIVRWENDGRTVIENGIPLCFTHHHYVHEGRWQITYDPATGVTTLTGPAGQTITSQAWISVAPAA